MTGRIVLDAITHLTVSGALAATVLILLPRAIAGLAEAYRDCRDLERLAARAATSDRGGHVRRIPADGGGR